MLLSISHIIKESLFLVPSHVPQGSHMCHSCKAYNTCMQPLQVGVCLQWLTVPLLIATKQYRLHSSSSHLTLCTWPQVFFRTCHGAMWAHYLSTQTFCKWSHTVMSFDSSFSQNIYRYTFLMARKFQQGNFMFYWNLCTLVFFAAEATQKDMAAKLYTSR